MAEDDGAARDKKTRLQHLDERSRRGQGRESPRFEVVACIDGRDFGVRREDMKKLFLATRGKMSTLKTLDRMVVCAELGRFGTQHAGHSEDYRWSKCLPTCPTMIFVRGYRLRPVG